MNKKMDPPHLVLSSPEMLCLQYANAGMTLDEIAQTMNLSIRTVKFCLLNAEKKLEWLSEVSEVTDHPEKTSSC